MHKFSIICLFQERFNHPWYKVPENPEGFCIFTLFYRPISQKCCILKLITLQKFSKNSPAQRIVTIWAAFLEKLNFQGVSLFDQLKRNSVEHLHPEDLVKNHQEYCLTMYLFEVGI